MNARSQGLGQTSRVILCAAMVLAVLLWLLISGGIWMSFNDWPLWPSVQFVVALGGQASLIGAFLMADDGRRRLASRLGLGAALAFLLWLGLLDGAGLWPIVDHTGAS